MRLLFNSTNNKLTWKLKMTTFKNTNEPACNTESDQRLMIPVHIDEVETLKARVKELEEGLMLCAKALTSKESFQIVRDLLGGDL